MILSVALFIATTNPSAAEVLTTECTSTSGRSVYTLSFDLAEKKGLIRYRFMGQDITYRATIDQNDTDGILGRAVFESSRSGEVRGNPFSFYYSKSKKEFKELNTKARCK